MTTPPTATPAGSHAPIRLRELHWSDLALLARLETKLFAADAWTEQTWWAELAARPRRDYVLAEWTELAEGTEPADIADEARPVGPTGPTGRTGPGRPSGAVAGYAGLDLAGDTADVMTVAVLPAYRGRGVGAVLVDWLVGRARDRGAHALLLEVRADNAPALARYRRHGFTQLTVRRRYYQPGDVDALVLRRLLTGTGAEDRR